MKRKAGIFILDFILLLACAVAVFFIGYINFYVDIGKTGVMMSKTGGVYEKPIRHGELVWRWERLLPTNVKLLSFETNPYSFSKTISGSLPSAEIYKEYVSPSPDFNYDVQMNITLKVSSDKLVDLVKNGIETQEDLENYLKSFVSPCAQKTFDYLKLQDFNVQKASLSLDEIESLFSSREFAGIEVIAVDFNRIKLPDMELYIKAKEMFDGYETNLAAIMNAKAEAQASTLMSEERTMIQLEKFAQLLQKYPELQDYSKNGDLNQLMNLLRNNIR